MLIGNSAKLKFCGYERCMKFKKAIVTGGTSGIGLAICEELLSAGTEVYSVSRNPEKIKPRENFHLLKLDLSDLKAVSSFGSKFLKRYGTPDLLVNNAGFGAFYEWKEFPNEEIERQINVLVSAPILLCKFFAPGMEQQGKGIIINISSLATLYPLPYMPLYNASKSALSSFTQSMMLEYSESLRWIDFRMGDIRTGFNETAPKQKEKSQSQSMNRAWLQIEKQLNESPSAKVAARQIYQSIKKNKSGTIFGGGFFQAKLAPLFYRILPFSVLIKVLKIRYK